MTQDDETSGVGPSYESVIVLLDHVDAKMPPEQFHAIMTGLICTGVRISDPHWLVTIFGTENISTEAKTRFQDLFAYTASSLDDINFSFELLLPDDNYELPTRVQALGQWCESFLTGLGLGGLTDSSIENEDVKSILENLVEIAQIDEELISIDDEDEKALLEVMEYVKLAVISIYQELCLKSSTDGEQSSHVH